MIYLLICGDVVFGWARGKLKGKWATRRGGAGRLAGRGWCNKEFPDRSSEKLTDLQGMPAAADLFCAGGMPLLTGPCDGFGVAGILGIQQGDEVERVGKEGGHYFLPKPLV